ncbi:MAG: hypothetical protein M3R24_08560 [Chloroflexota bacterium]|nr:hypothetical protein [Chloroflexota bacterium]
MGMSIQISPDQARATAYTDAVFAPLDHDHQVERIAVGNETEVYCSDDRRFVIKLKPELGGDLRHALMHARIMQAAAEQFITCLGPDHTIHSAYVIARDALGNVQVLVVQQFVEDAVALDRVDYQALSAVERKHIARQLRSIIRRSLQFYQTHGRMPDLYGRTSTSAAERARLNRPWMLPLRLWSFLVQRNLLRSHNLMLTAAPERRIVLVDYDLVRRGWLYRRVYFAVRWLLFWRDRLLLWFMRQSHP